MTSMPRHFAAALAVSAACGVLAAAVFTASLAVLPAPRLVADVLLRHAAPAGIRVDSTVAEGDPRAHGS